MTEENSQVKSSDEIGKENDYSVIKEVDEFDEGWNSAVDNLQQIVENDLNIPAAMKGLINSILVANRIENIDNDLEDLDEE